MKYKGKVSELWKGSSQPSVRQIGSKSVRDKYLPLKMMLLWKNLFVFVLTEGRIMVLFLLKWNFYHYCNATLEKSLSKWQDRARNVAENI